MSDDKGHSPNEENSNDTGAEGGRVAGRPFSILMPADLPVWQEARRLVTDKNIRVEDLAIVAAQDPAIVIELLRTSNAMFFSGGRSPITSVKTAIVRLGSDVVLETLDKMKERQPLENEDIKHWFDMHRNRCKRTSIVATILAEALARTLVDDCQAVGLFMFVGEMLAVLHLGETYTKLAEDLSRSGINYRLAQDHKFDVEKMGVTYLRRHGVPEALLFVLDRDARARTPDRAIMKPLCQAAAEMVDAFDNNRWEKLAPGKTLAPKSALRMLQMNEAQYLRIYERVSEYLFSLRMLEEKKKQEALLGAAPGTEQPAAQASKPETSEQSALQNEISSIIKGTPAAPQQSAPAEKPKAVAPAEAPKKPAPTTVIKETNEKLNEQFNLKPSAPQSKVVPRVEKKAELKEPPKLRTSAGNQIVNNFSSICGDAKTSEELLTGLLQMLVDKGPFEKSAIIVVSKDRSKAIVVAARGPNIGNGQTIELTDPLNPLAQCFSKVQSFGNKEAACSPFGSKAFALSPIDADHDTPVALYADCGNNNSLTFEARRVFRTVVELLNQKLPQIPGGIPVEIG
ncbi:MAG: HDOD domain-containing protein [Oligoflexia bacterium]|nr:HDOD domain-containing protein [Oligoflexia bacterium]